MTALRIPDAVRNRRYAAASTVVSSAWLSFAASTALPDKEHGEDRRCRQPGLTSNEVADRASGFRDELGDLGNDGFEHDGLLLDMGGQNGLAHAAEICSTENAWLLLGTGGVNDVPPVTEKDSGEIPTQPRAIAGIARGDFSSVTQPTFQRRKCPRDALGHARKMVG